MSLLEDNTRFALLKAIVDAATAEIAYMREQHTGRLVERYQDEGTQSFAAKLPDGTKVASLILTVPKPSLEVKDPEAFLKWVKANHEVAVETVTHEAVPEQVIPASAEWSEEVVKPKALTTLLEGFQVTEDGVVDTTTGTFVDGVELKPALAPSQFSVRYEKGGRDRLADAYRSGKLDDLAAGTSLPQLGRG